MTVSSALDRKTFTGDDATTAFATTPVVFFDETDLQVYVITTATGVATLQSLTTDYTVSGGAGSTGTVTMLTAPASTEQLLVKRVMPITQAVDLVNNDASDAETMEDSLDKLTMIAQQLSAGSVDGGYPLRISDAETPTDALTVLPFDRASKLLGFNSAKELVVYDPADGANDSASVTFLQSGSGAVDRNVQARLRDLVSVLDFIPVAEHAAIAAQTSTTTLTTYIQAALDAVNTDKRGGLYVPAGLYNTGEINWPGNNITLMGAGSSYSYDTSATPRTIFKAVAGTSIVFDLVQTGTATDRTGNHLANFDVDGNSIAVSGIKCSGANIIERVRAKGCSTAGVLLANFTNSTRIIRCGLHSNSGYGLQVEGVSTTTYSVEDTIIRLNTAGGINLQSGAVSSFKRCAVESNTGPGLIISRPSSHTGFFSALNFENVWFENNASASPYFTLTIDAYNSTELRAIANVEFHQCRFNVSVATRKHMSLGNVRDVYFRGCQFDASTESDAVTLTSVSRRVGWIDSVGTYGTNIAGLTTTQINNALAQGSNCFVSETYDLSSQAKTTSVANSSTGEDNLQTYSLPLDTLHSIGRGVRISAWGTAANNGNAKTLKLYFGSEVIGTQSLTVSQAGVWEFNAIVLSTGTDTQDYRTRFFQAGATEIRDLDVGTTTQDDGAAITIKCTGEAVVTNDIVQEGMLVEIIS